MKKALLVVILSLLTVAPVSVSLAQVPCGAGYCSSGQVCLGNETCGLPGRDTGAGSSGPQLTELTNLGDAIINFINGTLVYVLGAIAFIVFIWGVFKAYILHGDSEDERKTGHQLVLWGIIAFVVIFSVWGLVALVGSIFNLSAGGHAPPYPDARPH